MKKNIFTLLALLVCAVGSAWATDEVVVIGAQTKSSNYTVAANTHSVAGYSADDPNTGTIAAASDGQTATGGSKTSKTSNIGSSLSTKGHVRFTVAAGETVRFYYYQTSGSDKATTFATSDYSQNTSFYHAATSYTAAAKNTLYFIDFVFPDAGTYAISQTDGQSVYIAALKFTAPASTTAAAKWDWQNNDLSEYNVNALNGTKDITVGSLTLHVCAAVEGTTVKLTDNGTSAQMNENTEIQVPVQSVSDVVTVVAYPGQFNYTVGGVAASANTTNHAATMKEVAQGYVSIVATATAYLYNIEVKQYAKAATPALQSFTAGETTYYADEQEWTESPTGTFSTTIYVASVPATAPTAVAYNGTLGSITYDAGLATIPVTLGEATATYKVTFSASKIITVVAGAGGTVDPSGEQPAENGGSLTITATPNSGYAFLNWTKASDGSWSSTTNPLTIENITANDTYTANFKQLYKVTYAQGDGNFGTTTKVTTTEYAGIDDQITLWDKNYYLGKNGYTLTGWNDGTASHALGEVVTLTGNTTMTAEYTANAAWLDDSQSQTVVTWAFSANPYVHVENATGYYVQQATINGNSVDIPMYITSRSSDTGYNNNGKFATSNGQVQARLTKLTIPAIKGMTVVANAKSGTTYIFRNFIKLGDNYPDGSTTSDAAAASATYTYSGENGTVDICFYTSDNIYLSSIVVTYPVTANAVTVNTASSGYTTYASGAALDFANAVEEGTTNKTLKAYVVSDVSATSVTLTEVTSASANTGVVLKGTASTAYSIPVTTTPAAVGTNNLTPVVNATTVAANSVYVVSGGKFCLYTGTAIPAGKAYLDASLIPAESNMLDFDFNETTGINMVNGSEFMVNGSDFYNLNGQRVAQPTKGLYIVNGYKVVVK